MVFEVDTSLKRAALDHTLSRVSHDDVRESGLGRMMMGPAPFHHAAADAEAETLKIPVTPYTLWYEESCTVAAALKKKVVLLVHGGPGGCSRPGDFDWWDPTEWRVVRYDQRGCGRSTVPSDKGFPALDSLRGDRERLQDGDDSSYSSPLLKATVASPFTIHDLVADIEILRQRLKVTHWAVAGSSWGSTLATAYAATHADHVTGLVVDGIFVGDNEEHKSFYGSRAASLYPAAYKLFLSGVGMVPQQAADSVAGYAMVISRYADTVFNTTTTTCGTESDRAVAMTLWTSFEEYVSAGNDRPEDRQRILDRMQQALRSRMEGAEKKKEWAATLYEETVAVMQLMLFPSLEVDHHQGLLSKWSRQLIEGNVKVLVVASIDDECCPVRYARHLHYRLTQAFEDCCNNSRDVAADGGAGGGGVDDEARGRRMLTSPPFRPQLMEVADCGHDVPTGYERFVADFLH